MCAIFLAVIEGVGIGFQRMMAQQTQLDVCGSNFLSDLVMSSELTTIFSGTSSAAGFRLRQDDSVT